TSHTLADVDPSQVTVTPATPFEVDTSGRSVGVRFTLPLWDDTEYTVEIDGVAALVARGRLDLLDPSLPRDRLTEVPSLTPRELQVLGLLADGLTNREVGARLFVSEKTVSVHVSNLLAKLGARGRTEAVTIAHRNGLLAEAVAAARAVSPTAARR
ncbi:MAG: helix-turn-helix domain-containing protein, partial [Actinomycetota bacterium]